jgi:mycobactin peptide synthetase MbtE
MPSSAQYRSSSTGPDCDDEGKFMGFSVLRRIEETALAHGDLIAMEEGERRLSYAGLVECIRHVGRQGLAMPGPGLVGVNGRPSIEAGIGILAAMASGDVAVPVDERLPPARQQALLDWCDVAQDRGAVSAILADLACGAKAPGAAASVVAARTERQPAYVTFTSGTTGKPKAIEGTMEGIDHFMAWQSRLVGTWIDRPRVSWLTPLSFDVMYRDLLLPLCTQGTLVIPDGKAGFNIASGWNWLIGQDIDIAHVVPSIMGAWLAGGDLPPLPAAALFFAGEPLKRHLVDDLKSRYAGRIYNLYGPSETTMAKFCRRVDDGCPTPGGLYPVGRPIDEAVAYELAKDGEVVIRSPFLANGYRQKDGTVTPFPVASPGWRAYATGDRGEVIDGELYLLGRIDGQMKVNGIRIEAGEVERLAEGCVGVARAVVVKLAPPEAPLETLALFHQGDKVCEATLRAHLADNLHPAVVPTLYGALGSFPVTINGKVDRAALVALALRRLAAPAGEDTEAEGEREAPPGAAASHVQAVISKVLRRPCGLDTDFVSIGGNSLMSGLIALELEASFGISLPQDLFYRSGTPRAIARWLEDNGGVYRPPVDEAKGRPARPAQGRDWPLTSRQRTIYNIFCTKAVGAAINMTLQMPVAAGAPERIREAVSQVVAGNDCFHLRFRQGTGGLRQYFVPTRCEVDDFEEVAAREADFDRLATAFCERAFDIETERPFRLLLLSAPSGAGRLVLSMHHLISDGMSREYIRRDIEDGLKGVPVAPRTPFSSVLALQCGEKSGSAAHWLRHIRDAPPMKRFIAGPDRHDMSGRSLTVPLGCDHAALLATAKEMKTGVFPYLMSHFYRAMARHVGVDDLIIRVTTHGRYRPELLDTLGLVFSAVPLRLDCAAAPTREIVAYLDRLLDEAREHQDVGFEDLARLIGQPPDEHIHPVTGISFALDGYDVSERMPADLALAPRGGALRASLPHEMLAFARPYDDGCVLRFLYRTKAFSDDDILAIVSRMRKAIEGELAARQ